MQSKETLKQMIIGITGGIGTGKSEVVRLMESKYAAFVIQTDELAKRLQEPGQPGYIALVKQLGKDILAIDQTIDRQKLGAKMFEQPAVLLLVNQIIHPLVWQQVKDMIRLSSNPLIVVESALFLENAGDICDELWYVYTSRAERLLRLINDRGYSREKAVSMMDHQPSDELFKGKADRIIENNGTVKDLEQQLEKLLGKSLSKLWDGIKGI